MIHQKHLSRMMNRKAAACVAFFGGSFALPDGKFVEGLGLVSLRCWGFDAKGLRKSEPTYYIAISNEYYKKIQFRNHQLSTKDRKHWNVFRY